MRKVSRHLYPFNVKRGICQLTDHAYDMSMSIFCNYSVTVILNTLMYRKTWYANTCAMNGHGLTI
jgi:hypothetical protein